MLEWIKELILNVYFRALLSIIATIIPIGYFSYRWYNDYKFNKWQDEMLEELMNNEREEYKRLKNEK